MPKIKKLLSLPPNVVENFHSITGLTRDEYFCTCDPIGHKLGSGGGTVWVNNAYKATVKASPDERRIIIHGGGQSRRLPAYAPSGKLLTPVPIFRWERGQRIDQCLLDLQLPLYESIMERTPKNLNTLVASGDVFLRATQPLQDIPDADVVCYGLWATPEQISHHGVFMMRRDNPSKLDFMLQKPSTEDQAALMQTHFALIDVGVWLLSERAIDMLTEKSKQADGTVGYYDLYSEFGCALGENPSRADKDLEGLKVEVLPLPGGEFYHFGTGAEMLRSSMELQNLVKDQRLIIQRGVKKQSSVFTQNSIIPFRFSQEQEHIWVENSVLNDGWQLSRRNIVTGVPENIWKVSLGEGICLDVVPIGEKAYALRPYGYDDAFRGSLTDRRTMYMGEPFGQWAERHSLRPEDFSGTDDLQAARLFPVSESVEELGILLEWMLAENPDRGLAEVYRSARRVSADELSDQANLTRLFCQRRKLLAHNLSELQSNWERSVFYQADLNDISEKYQEEGITLPPPLPDTAPLLTRISDAMFHGDEAKAFGLLKDGLTANALSQKVCPRMTTHHDQIVWGRSAVRIDIAGGWTDTPPYCLHRGGNVVNVAINLNGQQPLQVYVKPCKEAVIICRSIDLGASERIETYEELSQFNKVGSPFSIPKAALSLCGFLPRFGVEPFPTLRSQLEAFGCGIEVTLLSAIPAGSGLGTSSILAATVLGALSDFCGLGWDKNEIGHRTLVLEQLLTTGGGWQDQYGGILPGLKLLQTGAGFDQSVVVRHLPTTIFTCTELSPCHLLYYTGITRTAKHILAEIVRSMFLNSSTQLSLLADMKAHALELFEAVELGDFGRYGRLVRHTWEQNKRLDSGTNPPAVEELCRCVDDLCLGYKLPGAGGGGFMYMVAKDAEAALRIRRRLSEEPLNPNARFVEMNVSQTGLEVSRS